MNLKVIFVFILISFLASHDAFAFLPLTPATIIIQQTSTGKSGTYNQTLANNVIINSGGKGLNFKNGTNSPVQIVNDPTRNQINITVSDTTGASGVTSLNALTGALTIACVSGNTTCTSSGGNTITINTAYNVVTTGFSAQTIAKQITLNNLVLGGDENVGSNALTNGGHKSTLPSTSGTLCQINQTATCGGAFASITSINSQTGPAVNIVPQTLNTTIVNSTNQVKVGIGTNVATLAGNQTFTGTKTYTPTGGHSGLNVGIGPGVITTGNAGDLYGVTSQLRYKTGASTDRAVIMDDGSQTMTNKIFLSGTSSSLADASDNTKRIKWLLSGMTTGRVITIQANQSSSQKVGIPIIRENETFAMQPQTNSKTNSTAQTTTSTTLVFAGNAITITPQITGRIHIHYVAQMSSNTAGDGCNIGIRQGTGTPPTAGQAVSGTTIGLDMTVDSGSTNANAEHIVDYPITGLVVGTQVWFEPVFDRHTGGTCSLTASTWFLDEY